MTVSMLWPAFSWAFDSTANLSQSGTFLVQGRPLHLPKQLGTIRRLVPAGPKTVFYIEDLHCNYEVQKNIAAIIGHLARHYHLKLVGQEGAFAPIDTGIIQRFPLAELKEEVSEFLLRQGRMTGAELASIRNDSPLQLEGIDDPGLFQASQTQIKDIVNNENLGCLADFRTALETLEPYVYNPNLQALARLKRQYREGHLPLPDYGRSLLAQARRLGLALDAYMDLEQYEQHPSDVDPDRLFQDMAGMENILADRLATKEEEKRILQGERWLELVEKITAISATPSELLTFRQHSQYNAAFLYQDLKRMANDHRITIEDTDLTLAVTSLNQALGHARQFYLLADRRSTAFVEHLLKKMSATGQPRAILIGGGYHTAAVLEALRQKGISTVLITPGLTKHDRLNPYFQLLQGRPTPLEALFQKHQTKMALRSIFEQPAFMGRVQAILKPLGFWVKDHSKHKTEALDRFLSQNQDEYSQPRPWTAQQKQQARCAQWMSIGQAMVAGVSKEVVVMPRNHGSAEFAMPENLFQADILPHWIIAHVDNEYQVKALVKQLGSKLNEDWGTKIKAFLFTPARVFKSGVDSLFVPKQPLIDRIANAIAIDEEVNLCFVCLTNRNRSALAELLAQYQINLQGKSNVTVTSGGWYVKSATYDLSIDQHYLAVIREAHVPIDKESLIAFRSRPITSEVLKKSDLIVVASPEIKKKLLNLHPAYQNKVLLMTDFNFFLKLRYGGTFPDPVDGTTSRKRMVELLSKHIINRLFQPKDHGREITEDIGKGDWRKIKQAFLSGAVIDIVSGWMHANVNRADTKRNPYWWLAATVIGGILFYHWHDSWPAIWAQGPLLFRQNITFIIALLAVLTLAFLPGPWRLLTNGVMAMGSPPPRQHHDHLMLSKAADTPSVGSHKSDVPFYFFYPGYADGDMGMRDILSAKGANLSEMAKLNGPVPIGFVIPVGVANKAIENKGFYTNMIMNLEKAMKRLETMSHKRWRSGKGVPLLISVRSGAPDSAPGKMKTVTYLGLNQRRVKALAKATDPRFAWQAYARGIREYGVKVHNVKPQEFDPLYTEVLAGRQPGDLEAQDWRKLVRLYRKRLRGLHLAYPEDINEQMHEAIKAVAASWDGKPMREYREQSSLADTGTAVIIQEMVFGDRDGYKPLDQRKSGSGVLYSRHPITGEKGMWGVFSWGAVGEDIVSGAVTANGLVSLAERLPHVYRELERLKNRMEKHYRTCLDMEFTIEAGRLAAVQLRSADRLLYPLARIRSLLQMKQERLKSDQEIMREISLGELAWFEDALKAPWVDEPKARNDLLANGLACAPGVASGRTAFNRQQAQALITKQEPIILVVRQTNAGDEDLIRHPLCQGVIEAYGNVYSHGAALKRQARRFEPVVTGVAQMKIQGYGLKSYALLGPENRRLSFDDPITVDGNTGRVYHGDNIPVLPYSGLLGHQKETMVWTRTIKQWRHKLQAKHLEEAAHLSKIIKAWIGQKEGTEKDLSLPLKTLLRKIRLVHPELVQQKYILLLTTALTVLTEGPAILNLKADERILLGNIRNMMQDVYGQLPHDQFVYLLTLIADINPKLFRWILRFPFNHNLYKNTLTQLGRTDPHLLAVWIEKTDLDFSRLTRNQIFDLINQHKAIIPAAVSQVVDKDKRYEILNQLNGKTLADFVIHWFVGMQNQDSYYNEFDKGDFHLLFNQILHHWQADPDKQNELKAFFNELKQWNQKIVHYYDHYNAWFQRLPLTMVMTYTNGSVILPDGTALNGVPGAIGKLGATLGWDPVTTGRAEGWVASTVYLLFQILAVLGHGQAQGWTALILSLLGPAALLFAVFLGAHVFGGVLVADVAQHEYKAWRGPNGMKPLQRLLFMLRPSWTAARTSLLLPMVITAGLGALSASGILGSWIMAGLLGLVAWPVIKTSGVAHARANYDQNIIVKQGKESIAQKTLTLPLDKVIRDHQVNQTMLPLSIPLPLWLKVLMLKIFLYGLVLITSLHRRDHLRASTMSDTTMDQLGRLFVTHALQEPALLISLLDKQVLLSFHIVPGMTLVDYAHRVMAHQWVVTYDGASKKMEVILPAACFNRRGLLTWQGRAMLAVAMTYDYYTRRMETISLEFAQEQSLFKRWFPRRLHDRHQHPLPIWGIEPLLKKLFDSKQKPQKRLRPGVHSLLQSA